MSAYPCISYVPQPCACRSGVLWYMFGNACWFTQPFQSVHTNQLDLQSERRRPSNVNTATFQNFRLQSPVQFLHMFCHFLGHTWQNPYGSNRCNYFSRLQLMQIRWSRQVLEMFKHQVPTVVNVKCHTCYGHALSLIHIGWDLPPPPPCLAARTLENSASMEHFAWSTWQRRNWKWLIPLDFWRHAWLQLSKPSNSTFCSLQHAPASFNHAPVAQCSVQKTCPRWGRVNQTAILRLKFGHFGHLFLSSAEGGYPSHEKDR